VAFGIMKDGPGGALPTYLWLHMDEAVAADFVNERREVQYLEEDDRLVA
jgi:hypothetical protein